MSYDKEIVQALENVPNDISLWVLMDINTRITDWLSSGGAPDSPYIEQQVRYAKNIGQKYGQQKKPLTAGKQSQ